MSQTLRYLVEGAARSVVPEVTTTIESPDVHSGAGQDEPRISVYLLQVAPDPLLRSDDLPTRSASGELVASPRVAINLRYILTFLGPAAQAQLMLGAVELALHENAYLGPALVADAVHDHPVLRQSGLGDQRPLVMLAPLPWDLEEFSRMWTSFFQRPYRLATLYEATGLVLDAGATTVAALPVHSPRPAGGGRPRTLDPLGAVQWGPGVLVPVSGQGLAAGDRLDVAGIQAVIVAAGAGLAFALPEGVPAGIVEVRPYVSGGGALGAGQPLVVRPQLNSVAVDPSNRTAVATTSPGIGAQQAVALSLVRLTTPGEPPASVKVTTIVARSGTSVTFAIPALSPGTYVAMVDVDGVTSIPRMEAGRYADPKVEVP